MTQRRGSARKVDANQAEIVDALRCVGCEVFDMSAVGRGMPDLLVRRPGGQLALIEVKNPKAKGKLNKLQQEFHQAWAGVAHVVYTVDEAFAALGIVTR